MCSTLMKCFDEILQHCLSNASDIFALHEVLFHMIHGHSFRNHLRTDDENALIVKKDKKQILENDTKK